MRAFQLLLLCASACANVVLQSGWASGSSSLDTGHTDEPAQLEPTQQRASAELSDYVDASGAFMQQFESHLREAGRSCKPSPFGMPSPSSRSIMRRPDRQALKQAFDHMSALHSQALSLARDSQLQAFASASLTLQQHLRVWLIDADKPTPASALLDEPTITALRSLRKACLKKPRGTVASTLETLGRELAEAEAASLALAHAALSTLDASQHGPRTSPAHSHRAEMERLEFEQLAQRAREAEEQLVELAAQFEAQAGQLRASKEGAHQAELVARGEVAAEVRGAAESVSDGSSSWRARSKSSRTSVSSWRRSVGCRMSWPPHAPRSRRSRKGKPPHYDKRQSSRRDSNSSKAHTRNSWRRTATSSSTRLRGSSWSSRRRSGRTILHSSPASSVHMVGLRCPCSNFGRFNSSSSNFSRDTHGRGTSMRRCSSSCAARRRSFR